MTRPHSAADNINPEADEPAALMQRHENPRSDGQNLI